MAEKPEAATTDATSEPEIRLPSREPTTTDSLGLSIVTSFPDEIKRHNISDETLDMLTGSRREVLLEVTFAAVGALLGSAPTALPTLWRSFFDSGQFQISGIDMAHLVIFVAGLATAIGFGALCAVRGRYGSELADAIRNRTKKERIGS